MILDEGSVIMALKVYKLKELVDLDRWPWFRSLRGSLAGDDSAGRTVDAVIGAVRRDGDHAVVRYMRRWTDPGFTTDRIAVPEAQLDEALKGLDARLRDDLQSAIDHVRAYQEHILPAAPKVLRLDGAELGLRFTPIQKVGLLVPGGRAVYPSTVVMLAVPALVAGVPPEGITVVTPPPTRELAGVGRRSKSDETMADGANEVSPIVLGTCAMLGVRRVYRIGGAQAVAALAMGTETVEAVDFIAGPGNVYTQLAKLKVNGLVGIDGFYGPSEIVTVADRTADAQRVAGDLIAQAEHDPGRCVLVAWESSVITAVNAAIRGQLRGRKRGPAITKSFKESSGAVLAPNEESAAQVCDRIAAEHVNLAVAEPKKWLARLRHGGEFFLGDQTPVAAGDYWAGPSHCLPTGTTARFASGVSVYTFLKRSGTVHYPRGMPREAVEAIARLAEAEGLDGHAASVRLRGGD